MGVADVLTGDDVSDVCAVAAGGQRRRRCVNRVGVFATRAKVRPQFAHKVIAADHLGSGEAGQDSDGGVACVLDACAPGCLVGCGCAWPAQVDVGVINAGVEHSDSDAGSSNV